LKQVEKDWRLKSLISHHDNPSVNRAAQTQMLNTLSWWIIQRSHRIWVRATSS
jgi:hypothetical protein